MSASAFAKSTAAEPSIANRSTAWQLPIELLLQCLIAADLVTRIRASHVSRTWREAALAERRLWDSFACSRFRDKQHEDAMFCLLEAMLLRSRALPFYLAIPHVYYPKNYEYCDRLLRLEGFDISRLAAYRGPVTLFLLLNPTQMPLPKFVRLDVLSFYNGEHETTTISMDAQLSARCLPNLRELVAPSAVFPEGCAPFTALRSITFGDMCAVLHRTLFAHCPRLVRMEIKDSAIGTPLPDPPVPPSLEEVSICCTQPRVLELVSLMAHWRGIRIPRVVARPVYSLRNVMPLFLSSHAKPIKLSLLHDDGTVALSTIPDDESVWTLSPPPRWADDFLSSIEKPTPERLTSICIAFSRLEALLAAQLHAPGLEKLELRVHCAADADPPPLQPGDGIFLRAPRLRSVAFNLGDRFSDSLMDALGVLCTSFRAVIVYDAELLDTIAVSHGADRACAGFAPFAKEFLLDQKGF